MFFLIFLQHFFPMFVRKFIKLFFGKVFQERYFTKAFLDEFLLGFFSGFHSIPPDISKENCSMVLLWNSPQILLGIFPTNLCGDTFSIFLPINLYISSILIQNLHPKFLHHFHCESLRILKKNWQELPLISLQICFWFIPSEFIAKRVLQILFCDIFRTFLLGFLLVYFQGFKKWLFQDFRWKFLQGLFHELLPGFFSKLLHRFL